MFLRGKRRMFGGDQDEIFLLAHLPFPHDEDPSLLLSVGLVFAQRYPVFDKWVL